MRDTGESMKEETRPSPERALFCCAGLDASGFKGFRISSNNLSASESAGKQSMYSVYTISSFW